MRTGDPVRVAAEIEAIVRRLGAPDAGPESAEARQLLDLVMSFYGAGLRRMLDIIRTERRGPDAALERCAADPLVASLLALHDLEPHPSAGLIQVSRGSNHMSGHSASREHRCELCGSGVSPEHSHLLEVGSRRILCACSNCRLTGGRFRLVPTRYVQAAGMAIAPAHWESLAVPVGLAFFLSDSHLGRVVACYPSPAGPAESLLPLDAWPALLREYPWMTDLAPDVEALLVRRMDNSYRCFIVPIDACYELVGRIRQAWTGFGGGASVDREIDLFFQSIAEKGGDRPEVST